MTGLAIDRAGEIQVTGDVTDPGAFETTPDAFQRAGCGVATGFFRIFLPDATLKYSTFVPGRTGLAASPGGDIFLALQSGGEISRFDPKADNMALFCSVNAASWLIGDDDTARWSPVWAPGEILTLLGTGIGPAQGIAAQISGGQLPTELAGVKVLFDGVPAPILYAQANQINTFVPFSAQPRTSMSVRVEFNGRQSTVFNGYIMDSFPGIFITDNKQAGQGAILNEDGSVNSVHSPAKLGSVIQIFATGTGQTSPESVDGRITGPELPGTAQRVQVIFPGSTEGDVLYAGAAPGFVAGATQINVRLPSSLPLDVPREAVGISIRVGQGVLSPVLATVAVK